MRPKVIPHPPIENGTPFERFKEFAKRIISVPKSEIERREAKWKNQQSRNGKTN